MDLNEFRSFISDSGLDIWTWIDLSISVACADHENELRSRRDGIIQRLYAPAFSRCQSCDNQFSRGSNCDFKEVGGSVECKKKKDDVGFECINPEPLQSRNEVEEEDDDELKKILEIKTLLDDENQSDGCLIDLLQRLVAMDTSFQTLKDTDIGRHVSKLRKHSCNEVRKLVKFLVRKWKDTVDEWVRSNTPVDEVNQFNDDKTWPEEGHHESSASSPPKEKMEYNQIESDKLGSAKKRPHDHNSLETHHGSRQRTEIIRDFHNGPKLKTAVLGNNGGSVPVRNW